MNSSYTAPAYHTIRHLILSLLLAAFCPVAAQAAPSSELVTTSIDWPQFLSRHDLVWSKAPTNWTNAPFIGNGLLGTYVFCTPDGVMHWQIGSTEVWDHRDAPPGRDMNPAFERARLPLGEFTLQPKGKVVSVQMKLGLWDAELTGTIVTTEGTIGLRAYTHAIHQVIAAEFTTTGNEKDFLWNWHPAESKSPRANPAMKRPVPQDYVGNPPPQLVDEGSDHFCHQSMIAGGGYTTAWHEGATDPEHRQVFISVGYSTSDAAAANLQAMSAIKTALDHFPSDLLATHRAWWHSYYPESFISIPHTQLEGFYWIQMYKLASATRADKPALDLYGPWQFPTAWPYMCWNMNVQVAYSPVYAANRLELGDNLCRMLESNVDHLRENVAPGFQKDCAAISRATAPDGMGKVSDETGNLPWALHNFWRQCRWSGDDARLRDKFYPLLKLATNYYLRQIIAGTDGKLHLPKMYSPEYGATPDCNYDLSLLRWGLLTLIETAKTFQLESPADIAQWQNKLENLTDYPQDSDEGFLIGSDLHLTKAHRHYSHLLMIFPLRTVNWAQPANRGVIQRSLDHWMSVPGKDRLGFTYLGAASINASMGRGNEALADLESNLKKVIHPNTMYAENCNESPFGMCESLHDMFLHTLNPAPGTSRAPIIHVFPAIPDIWLDVTFHDLRAEGAFLVSGVRSGGKTQWVSIKSLAGKPCFIRPGFETAFKVKGVNLKPVETGDGVYELPLKQGEEVVLYSGADNFVVSPVAGNPAQEHFYGFH